MHNLLHTPKLQIAIQTMESPVQVTMDIYFHIVLITPWLTDQTIAVYEQISTTFV